VAEVSTGSTTTGAYASLTAVGNLTVNGNVTSDGYVKLSGSSVSITKGIVTAGAGDVLINGSSSISIGSSVSVIANTSGGTTGKIGQDSHDPKDGDIVILVGSLPPALVAGTKPAGFTVQTTPPGLVYWGTGTINAGGGQIEADDHDVVFSGGSSITLGSSLALTAQ
jgi:hypothetical protein